MGHSKSVLGIKSKLNSLRQSTKELDDPGLSSNQKAFNQSSRLVRISVLRDFARGKTWFSSKEASFSRLGRVFFHRTEMQTPSTSNVDTT